MPRHKKSPKSKPNNADLILSGGSSPLSQSPSNSSIPDEESYETLLKPIFVLDEAEIEKGLTTLDEFQNLQLAKVAGVPDSVLFTRCIQGLCRDARTILQHVLSKQEQRCKLTLLAREYFNPKHPTGRLFFDATLMLIAILVPDDDAQLLPNATKVSVGALIKSRSRSASFLFPSRVGSNASSSSTPDLVFSNHSI